MHAKRASSRLVIVACALLVILLLGPRALSADEADDAWAALAKGGSVALIRHGNAPPGYGGDPPGMRIEDCATQRNLDDKGREQSKAIGEALRKHGVRVDRVAASPLCRCQDTARLMWVGSVETSWALLPDIGPTPSRFLQLKELVSSWSGPGTLVLVTHAMTIAPVAGFMPRQAEIVVLQPAPGHPRGGTIVGKIEAPRLPAPAGE